MFVSQRSISRTFRYDTIDTRTISVRKTDRPLSRRCSPSDSKVSNYRFSRERYRCVSVSVALRERRASPRDFSSNETTIFLVDGSSRDSRKSRRFSIVVGSFARLRTFVAFSFTWWWPIRVGETWISVDRSRQKSRLRFEVVEPTGIFRFQCVPYDGEKLRLVIVTVSRVEESNVNVAHETREFRCRVQCAVSESVVRLLLKVSRYAKRGEPSATNSTGSTEFGERDGR